MDEKQESAREISGEEKLNRREINQGNKKEKSNNRRAGSSPWGAEGLIGCQKGKIRREPE